MRRVSIGHYVGAFPDVDFTISYEIRRGPQILALTEEELRVWAAPERPDASPEALADLVAGGLVAEVGDDGIAFGRSHRLIPLVLGLGPSADEPGRYALGTPGSVVATADPRVYELWAAAAAFANLAELCQAFAVARGTTDAQVLADLLAELPGLQSAGAACVDIARPAPGAS